MEERIKALERANKYLSKEVEDLESQLSTYLGLYTIPNSSITWEIHATNLNFTDREIMELLEKLYQQHPAQTILSHLEKLANGL